MNQKFYWNKFPQLFYTNFLSIQKLILGKSANKFSIFTFHSRNSFQFYFYFYSRAFQKSYPNWWNVSRELKIGIVIRKNKKNLSSRENFPANFLSVFHNIFCSLDFFLSITTGGFSDSLNFPFFITLNGKTFSRKFLIKKSSRETQKNTIIDPCNQGTKIGIPKVFRRIPKNSSTNIDVL